MATTTQEYTDTLYKIQCCYGTLLYQKSQQQYIGFECSELESKIKLLYAILRALLRQDITLIDADACLTEEQINCLIDRAKIICKDCCYDHVDKGD